LFNEEGDGLDAVIHRMGIIATRIAGIVCVLRHYDHKSEEFKPPLQHYIMESSDLELGMFIAELFISHTHLAYKKLSTGQSVLAYEQLVVKYAQTYNWGPRKLARYFGDGNIKKYQRILAKYKINFR
jgi:hypothetical protein